MRAAVFDSTLTLAVCEITLSAGVTLGFVRKGNPSLVGLMLKDPLHTVKVGANSLKESRSTKNYTHCVLWMCIVQNNKDTVSDTVSKHQFTSYKETNSTVLKSQSQTCQIIR